MEIAAYPVPYATPLFPQPTEAKPARANNAGLASRDQGSSTLGERVLQGEVLNSGKRKSANDASSSYTFEQQSRRATPDLSGLDRSTRHAIQSYLDNDTQTHPLFSTRPLIDEYV